MITRVYQFGCLAPTTNEDIVREQLVAAWKYRNFLVSIERGRRWALRAILVTDEIREAEDLVRAATKSTRKATRKALRSLRKETLLAATEETERIAELDGAMRRQARAHTDAYWGTYLGIEASADQVRKMPLYEDDGLTPNDPRFVRWSGVRADSPGGQIGVQLQGGLSQATALACVDRRAWLRIDSTAPNGARYGVLGLRVGSVGRDPVWTEAPIKLHRDIPAEATWKWARLSRRTDALAERWTCEITCEIPDDAVRASDRPAPRRSGVLAIEVMWFDRGDEILVARWQDSDGDRGDVLVPARIVKALRKVADIQSIRDGNLNAMRDVFARELGRAAELLPPWLTAAKNAPAWRSAMRFHRLVRRWRDERCDAARAAYDVLQAWELRDEHLWSYEAGARTGALRSRLDLYRTLARRWADRYAVVVLPDRDLSREARWSDDSDRRFMAGPSELRECVDVAFGSRSVDLAWTEDDPDDEGPSWIERAIAHGARVTARAADLSVRKGGAWATRRAKKVARIAESGVLENSTATTSETT